MRIVLPLPCEGETLFATLDGEAGATAGWVFVTGGTQTRVGPHRLYERLAARLAEGGHAVIRFDRRGVGDSSGSDPGYLGSDPDLDVATLALRAHFPSLRQVNGFGLCDGASALARCAGALGLSMLLLANPWVVEPRGDLPPPAAIRGHYARRSLDPKAWLRLLSGRIDLGRLVRGIAQSAAPQDDSLVRRFADGISGHDARILLAEGDGTAQAFAAAWRGLADDRPPATIQRIPTASHSFAEPAAFEALASALLAAAVTPPR